MKTIQEIPRYDFNCNDGTTRTKDGNYVEFCEVEPLLENYFKMLEIMEQSGLGQDSKVWMQEDVPTDRVRCLVVWLKSKSLVEKHTQAYIEKLEAENTELKLEIYNIKPSTHDY